MSLTRRALVFSGAATPFRCWPQPRAAADPAEIPERQPAPPEQDTGRFAGRRWRIQRIVDEDRRDAVLSDLCFAGSARGIAVGAYERGGHQEPHALLTRDGGARWTEAPLKDFPLSLFLLDDSRAFFVGRKSLWRSSEGGAEWNRRPWPKPRRGRAMLRVHFLDEKRGWAYGLGKVFYATVDGGESWKPAPESAALNLKDENTVWTCMAFLDAQRGLIAGFSSAPFQESERFPDWMTPERAARRRVRPSTTVLGETHDAGATWTIGYTSTFGRVSRLRTLGQRGLAIYHYGDGFAFPSEVYLIDFATGKSRPVFRRRDLWVHDAVLLAGGEALLAAIEPPGRLRSSPVPGRLRMFYSQGAQEWSEMKVDYRAEGASAILAAAGENHLWTATDLGTILRLS